MNKKNELLTFFDYKEVKNYPHFHHNVSNFFTLPSAHAWY